MTKFRKGDVVQRVGCGTYGSQNGMSIGDTDIVIAVVEDICGDDLILKRFGGGHDGRYFALFSDDSLPDAPTDVLYVDQYTAVTGRRTSLHNGNGEGVRVRLSPYEATLISVSVGSAGWRSRLDADSALQLAHDLRRMAMDIKRKEKLNA